MGRLIDEYQVDGVLEMTLQACHTYNVETRAIRKFVNEEKEFHTLTWRQIILRQMSDSSIQELRKDLLKCCKIAGYRLF